MIYAVTAIVAVSVIIDQVLKLIVSNALEIGHTMPVIDGVFHFTYVQNFGAAFSILQNRQWFLILVTSAVMIVAAVILVKNIKKFTTMLSVSLALIIGGGIGNLIDRIRLGYVVDFIDCRFINFPVFNFADCCVVVGAFLLIIAVFVCERKEKKEK